MSEYFGGSVDRVRLEDVSPANIPNGSVVISTIELEDPILEETTPQEMEWIRVITDNSSTLVWVSGGGLFKAERPSFSLVHGFARSVMLEQPSLKMFLIDFDVTSETHSSSVANTLTVLHQGIHSSKPEFEYLQHDSVLYSSRFVPEESKNKRFRQGQNAETVDTALQNAGNCQLNIKSPGQLDSLHFTQRSDGNDVLQPGYVEVRVQAVGLNAKVCFASSCRDCSFS